MPHIIELTENIARSRKTTLECKKGYEYFFKKL